ncbi:MAG TPA: prolyl oligopeptidase family serine peptidase, partial [Sunxiuqinia sp.]|nr:prolyl oligopeptidase family serine peptidase [Sunxiuqinia sp.]
HPKIYLCKPVPAYGNRWGINDSIIVHGVIPVVKKIAKIDQLPIIDLYKALTGKGDLFPDQIHPNAQGAGLMAKAIYHAITGNKGQLVPAEYPGKHSVWHGFDRYDFQLDRRDCHMILPQKSAKDHPWVWRARFPEWHYQMDSILLSKGLAVVYTNTDKEFGSTKAVKAWDNFYNYLTGFYEFNKKVALEGVSRGGLFAYAFAKQYPERVACIYAEAPVCNIVSWPEGKGIGLGDSVSWHQLIVEYDFKNEQEAENYADNPFQNLANLAKIKVPIFHSIGLNDSIVPPTENTFKLVNNYVRLGGPATIYPNTESKQSLHGHHFEIDNVQAGVNFILNSYGRNGD